jgi:branched-chain amino acid transport system permease protein
VAAVLYELANKLDWLTGGADGLQGVVMGPLLGKFEFDLYGRVAYAYSLIVLVIVMLIARRIVHSPFGYSLKALRDNRLRATSVGLSVNLRLARGLHAGGGVRGLRGCADGADLGLRLA